MVSAVRSRPNHYDALGLTPAASDDDIARAFARKMEAFRWHPAGAAAQLWIAYETLRDRIKRADYDRSLGLAPRRQQAWSMAVTQQQWTPFIAAPAARTADAAPPASERPAEPQVSAPVQRDAPLDPRLESIAASIRELSKPVRSEAAADPRPPLAEPPARKANADLEFVLEDIRALTRAERERPRTAEDGSVSWKRPAQIVGGLIIGAGVLGAVIGLTVRDNSAPAEAEASPPQAAAKLHSTAAASPAQPLASVTLDANAGRTELFPARPKPRRHQSASAAARQADQGPVTEDAALDTQPEGVASDPQAADPLAPRPAAAKLPLSNAVIARTIDRIGYRCGEVASTAPVEGAAPGTFSVTCSSGQTYQAAPSHGRYRFRRSSH